MVDVCVGCVCGGGCVGRLMFGFGVNPIMW